MQKHILNIHSKSNISMLPFGKTGAFSPPKAHLLPIGSNLCKPLTSPSKQWLSSAISQASTVNIPSENAVADKTAEEASQHPQHPFSILFVTPPSLILPYSKTQRPSTLPTQAIEAVIGPQDWLLLQNRYCLPDTQVKPLLTAIHKSFHTGSRPLYDFPNILLPPQPFCPS